MIVPKRLLVWFAVLFTTAGQVQGGVIARAEFGALAVNYDIENAVTGAITAGDGFLTLSDGEVESDPPGYPLTGNSYTNRGVTNPPSGGLIRFDFLTPVSAVGFNAYYNFNPVLFAVYDSDNVLLNSYTSSPQDLGFVQGFFGLDVGSNSISYATASVPRLNTTLNLFVDDVIYQSIVVPEPNSLALLGMGAFAAVACRRGKRAA